MTAHRYDILSDFGRVYDFLVETFDEATLNSYLYPAFWEYMHTIGDFEYARTQRMGIWESDGHIVGVATFDVGVGEAFLHARPEHTDLYPAMLDWAERELPEIKDGNQVLGIHITTAEPHKRDLLESRGYRCVHTEPVKIFRYDDTAFSDRTLPDGFAIQDLTGADVEKLAAFFWRAFDNPGEPDPTFLTDSWPKIISTPHCDLTLGRLVTAPNGDYACALGMWLDAANDYAYLEPLATSPDYRRLGLAEVALTDAMRATAARGARWCDGGANDFYTAIGFGTHVTREKWERTY
jgi:ribosomal protein S18 acetylase RimI-like enzyme